MTGDGRLHFAVLGSFRVDRDGREVDLGPRLQRTLLAILVVDAGHVVPVHRLIDLLWREEPPAAALASVQAYVSHLRRVLEPGRAARAPAQVLVTQDPGYVLRAGDGQVDALRFGALARQAHEDLAGDRPAAAAAGLADALALWRGDPLADFADQPWAVPAVTRLTEAHDLAAEDRVEAWLALGGHAQAAAELEMMVAARPLRERHWGQLIVATYRAAGRPMRCAPTSGAALCSRGSWAWSPGLSCGGSRPPCSPRTPRWTGARPRRLWWHRLTPHPGTPRRDPPSPGQRWGQPYLP